jgi:hypothetical protein
MASARIEGFREAVDRRRTVRWWGDEAAEVLSHPQKMGGQWVKPEDGGQGGRRRSRSMTGINKDHDQRLESTKKLKTAEARGPGSRDRAPNRMRYRHC